MKKTMRLKLAALTTVLVTGCASPPAAAPQPIVNLSGYPPEFKQGYADGCASATPDAARQRDDARFKADASYAQGWRDGRDICRKR